MWAVALTHFYVLTHQSSQRVRDVQPPHTPHYQTCAAAQKRFPGDGEEKKNYMSKIKRLQTRERWDERKRIRGGGVFDEKPKRKKEEEFFSKGLKSTRRIKPSRNSFALWGHRCTGFKPLFGGTDSSSVDVHEEKHKPTHSEDIPALTDLTASTVIYPEWNKYKDKIPKWL